MPDKRQGRTGLADNGLLQVNLATQILCITLVTPVVILRLIIRKRLYQPFSVEDVTCFLAWLLFMGYCTCCIMYGFAGGADNMVYLSQDEIHTTFKISYASTIIYAPLAMTVKVTLLLVLAKIYRPLRGALAVYIILALNVVYYLIILFVKAFICMPVSAYWTKTTGPDGSGTCLDRPAVLIADSLISVISDIAILVLPVVFTWPLQMRMRVKIKVVSLLGLGGIAVGFSLYRLVLLIVDGSTPDRSVFFMRVLLSGNAEGGIGLICACLPTLSKYITLYRQNRQASEHDQPRDCVKFNPIFDGTSNWNNGTQFASLQSHMETHIWRGSEGSAGEFEPAAMPLQKEISGSTAGRSSPLEIRTNVIVHRESENNPEYSPV
ncbi:hypothetical protein ASPVEDRAFT_155667 [Aspergillus versicolor CBS 583.65]|uniref:Rhodopsin domain-containing protein n=1 Tax=Aspergillus versicolor CBS 583.65 TaxID=1036611 RepID=A0A1L9Q2J9_ASPVE|nr:uncharacterized protein ASPVEDRAFT_155667 [Aspergillus versicolor CBS 583.65]OJJ07932.1 hypothetical protein ASPVEDRAFT_155667 [Aspergillus versicolor CBS 583.65]